MLKYWFPAINTFSLAHLTVFFCYSEKGKIYVNLTICYFKYLTALKPLCQHRYWTQWRQSQRLAFLVIQLIKIHVFTVFLSFTIQHQQHLKQKKWLGPIKKKPLQSWHLQRQNHLSWQNSSSKTTLGLKNHHWSQEFSDGTRSIKNTELYKGHNNLSFETNW